MNCHREICGALRICLAAALFVLIAIFTASIARADKIVLQDGREYEGRFTRLNGMLVDPNLINGAMPAPTMIVMCDNDLSYTYFPQKFVARIEPAAASARVEAIDVPQPVAVVGQRLGSVGSPLEIEKFDDHGRRNFWMAGGATGQIVVTQGISKITPVWCKVQGLQLTTSPTYVWDMRIATSSVPRDVLSKIIRKKIDPKNVDERLKIVRLYLQAERYPDATSELEQVIADFPGRDGLADVAHDLKQMAARQAIKEIETRKKSGQHGLASSILQTFPSQGVDGDLLQQVRVKIEEYAELQRQGKAVVDQMNAALAKLPEAARKRAEPAVKEVAEQLTINTLERMATFQRMAGAGSQPETEVALAISSWLLGATEATENLQLAMSMYDIRNLVREYLAEDTKVKRVDLLAKVKAQEAASPKLVAAITNYVGPPLVTAPQELPGYYKLTVPNIADEPPPTYLVQLPPEYDPHVNYPCVVTLHGTGSTAEQQISWWAGDFTDIKGQKLRNGQAGRNGYIVIAPSWTAAHQKDYEGSAREHDLVLSALRDACKRFSIDTDRIFLSGHSAGGTAAWDIGLAHPDLWAGIIPIVPTLIKDVQLNWKNAERLPLYFVLGEMDGDRFVKNAKEFDRYFEQSKIGTFDCTVSEFRGRGHEHFSDDILRIFDWMGRRQRNFFPKDFNATTHRSWDNYFWWVELRDYSPVVGRPPLQLESKLTATNGVSVSTGGKVTVWLSPEMIDFSRPITVNLNATPIVSPNKIQPSIDVILEDARGRADRRHPFWAKVE